MSAREEARLLRPDPPAEGDDDTDGDNGGGLSKSGFSVLFGLIAGNLIGSITGVSGAVPGIGIRILCISVIVVALDRALGVSRRWVPPALKRALARIG